MHAPPLELKTEASQLLLALSLQNLLLIQAPGVRRCTMLILHLKLQTLALLKLLLLPALPHLQVI